MEILSFILIGATAGIVMGTIGVGGGAIIISSLIFFAGLPQKMAQGTTLFIVAAPISLFAAINYFKEGHVNVKAGIIIMISFFIFSMIGSYWGTRLPNNILKPILGVLLILMGIKLLYSCNNKNVVNNLNRIENTNNLKK